VGRHWRELVWASLLVCGCASDRSGGGAATPLAPVRGLSGVSPEFFSAFDALRAAVDAHEDPVARRILQRTETRLETRREASWDDMGANERRSLEAADALAAGFARILDGRERVAALDLALTIDEHEGAPRLMLNVDSAWPSSLSLRPGPATLREEFVWVTALGRENRTVRYLGLEEMSECEVGPQRPWSRRIASIPSELPNGALAARWSWSLVLRSGAVLEAGARYPGMNWGVGATEHTIRAAYLPTTPVEPRELVDYLAEVDLTRARREQILPPVMERAVRIDPTQRAETLALLKPLVQRATPEKIERMIPALRWLARTNAPGSDINAWRQWMSTHGDPPPPRVSAGLDLPERRIR